MPSTQQELISWTPQTSFFSECAARPVCGHLLSAHPHPKILSPSFSPPTPKLDWKHTAPVHSLHISAAGNELVVLFEDGQVCLLPLAPAGSSKARLSGTFLEHVRPKKGHGPSGRVLWAECLQDKARQSSRLLVLHKVRPCGTPRARS